MVVDAALVALVVRRLRGLPYEGGEVVGLGQRGRAMFVQEPGGEVFGPVDVGGLGGQGPVPVRAVGRELRVRDR